MADDATPRAYDRNGEVLVRGDEVEWCLLHMDGKPKRPRDRVAEVGGAIDTPWGPTAKVVLDNGWQALTYCLEKVTPPE